MPRKNGNSGYSSSKRTENQVSLAATKAQTPFKTVKVTGLSNIKRTMLWRRLPTYFETQNHIYLVRI